MGNHMNNHVSSFNPACCFRPSQTTETTRQSSHGCVSSSNSSSSSSSSSSHAKSSSSRKSSSSFEPVSPRVGCMGHIKGVKTFSSSSVSSASSSNRSASTARGRSKLTKIKRILSGQKMRSSSVIDAANMDPPLPVKKRPVKDSKSLWKRRCGGDSIKHIQFQQQKQQQAAALPLVVLKSLDTTVGF